MKTHAQAALDEEVAVRDVVANALSLAKVFERVQRLRNMGGLYARALKALLGSARRFAEKSDEAWAVEVAELRGELARVHRLHVSVCAEADSDEACRCADFERTREALRDEPQRLGGLHPSTKP